MWLQCGIEHSPMEARRQRGSVRLLHFTVRLDDFANLDPRPPYRYWLVTQVFTAGGEYLCTQLLGIDLRAVKYLGEQGCEYRTASSVKSEDRERIQFCLDQYSRFRINQVANIYRHITGPGAKVQ